MLQEILVHFCDDKMVIDDIKGYCQTTIDRLRVSQIDDKSKRFFSMVFQNITNKSERLFSDYEFLQELLRYVNDNLGDTLGVDEVLALKGIKPST